MPTAKRLPRLSELSHGAGCACKLRPADLAQVLKRIPVRPDPKVLVGHTTSDDAAVYRLDARTGVISTADFFTPMVDDPKTFGRIAAANALSDVWAMGGRPLMAINLVAFPAKTLPLSWLHAILAGGAEKADEAGIAVVGGHSIDDPEPKYGMAVTGFVDPKRVLTNAAGRPGDLLVLTKPLGVGIVATAIKRKKAPPAVIKRAIESMTTLNKVAGELFAKPDSGVRALTDVTGFGLLGHLLEMCRGAKLGAELDLGAIPFLEGVGALAQADVVPGGTRANLEFVAPSVDFPEGLPEFLQLMLADAQTNGGLLAAVEPKRAAALVRRLERAGTLSASVIGRLVAGPARIRVHA